jgi:hypothetical protein
MCCSLDSDEIGDRSRVQLGGQVHTGQGTVALSNEAARLLAKLRVWYLVLAAAKHAKRRYRRSERNRTGPRSKTAEGLLCPRMGVNPEDQNYLKAGILGAGPALFAIR